MFEVPFLRPDWEPFPEAKLVVDAPPPASLFEFLEVWELLLGITFFELLPLLLSLVEFYDVFLAYVFVLYA